MRFVCETVKDLSSTRSIFDRGMETQYFREQAQRVRDIAEKADPFTKKRLLALAEYYEARALESPRPLRPIKAPTSLSGATFGKHDESGPHRKP
jgi:hypothetical protein